MHRLASLFWRLRRATSIETGLLRMQGEILLAFRSSRQRNVATDGGVTGASTVANREWRQDLLDDRNGSDVQPPGEGEGAASPSRGIALSYLRLANLDNDLIGRLSRYEAILWRQVVQTLFTLQTLKRR